jgi:hypothetical protein
MFHHTSYITPLITHELSKLEIRYITILLMIKLYVARFYIVIQIQMQQTIQKPINWTPRENNNNENRKLKIIWTFVISKTIINDTEILLWSDTARNKFSKIFFWRFTKTFRQTSSLHTHHTGAHWPARFFHHLTTPVLHLFKLIIVTEFITCA